MSWTLKFQALSEGTTTVNISKVTASASSGDDVTVVEGSSTVTIGEGDPSLITDDEETTESSGNGGDIEIDGQTYSVVTDIPEVLIPDGFVTADMPYNGNTYAATKKESGKMYAMYAIYLKDANGEEDFWLYDPDKDCLLYTSGQCNRHRMFYYDPVSAPSDRLFQKDAVCVLMY